jgi:site-specific DNA-cytosine methylase
VPFAVADPRLNCDVSDRQGRQHNNVYRVSRWDASGPTVTSGGGPSSGGVMVADPRAKWMKPGAYHNIYRVTQWSSPSLTVTGGSRPAAGCVSIADPRPKAWLSGRRHFNSGGHYGVASWDQASGAVVGHAKHDTGVFSVADPRFGGLPAPDDQPDPAPVIISLDGSWHRPLTTLECAAIQGFPVESVLGGSLVLDGGSHTAWRERIGNAVPPPAAAALGSVMAQTILLTRGGSSFMLSSAPIWVQPLAIALALDTGRTT